MQLSVLVQEGLKETGVDLKLKKLTHFLKKKEKKRKIALESSI